MHGVRFRSAIC